MPNGLPKPPSMQPPGPPQKYGTASIPPNYSSPDVEDRRHEPKTLSDWGVEPIATASHSTGSSKHGANGNQVRGSAVAPHDKDGM